MSYVYVPMTAVHMHVLAVHVLLSIKGTFCQTYNAPYQGRQKDVNAFPQFIYIGDTFKTMIVMVSNLCKIIPR